MRNQWIQKPIKYVKIADVANFKRTEFEKINCKIGLAWHPFRFRIATSCPVLPSTVRAATIASRRRCQVFATFCSATRRPAVSSLSPTYPSILHYFYNTLPCKFKHKECSYLGATGCCAVVEWILVVGNTGVRWQSLFIRPWLTAEAARCM